jgi:hypothetical protein
MLFFVHGLVHILLLTAYKMVLQFPCEYYHAHISNFVDVSVVSHTIYLSSEQKKRFDRMHEVAAQCAIR